MRVAWFLLLMACAGLIVACGASDPGAKLYVDLKCAGCHGAGGQGNRYGPALADLDERWQSDADLIQYMKDPQKAIEDNERLLQQANNFKLRMLPVKDASDKQLEVLAAWLRNLDRDQSI